MRDDYRMTHTAAMKLADDTYGLLAPVVDSLRSEVKQLREINDVLRRKISGLEKAATASLRR